MHQPGKWWIGLVPLALLWSAANIVKMDGVESDLSGRAKSAIASISSDVLDKPVVVAAGRDIKISGLGFSPQARDQAEAQASATFGVRKVNADIASVDVARPYVLKGTIDGTKVTLSGSVPTPSAKAGMLETLNRAIANVSIDDKSVFATGAPGGDYASAVAFALSELGKLKQGTVSFDDLAFSIAGSGKDDVSNASVAADTKTGLPSGYSVASINVTSAVVPPPVVVVPPPPPVVAVAPPPSPPPAAPSQQAPKPVEKSQCQSALAAALSKDTVHFRSASARLSRQSIAVLTTVAARIKQCSEASITMSGFTDSTGDVDANIRLSKARARAAFNFLIKRGVDAGRLSSAGRGEDSPVATNATAAGKAQNRRVEFSVT